jgi:hypothetical protein
VEVAQWAQQAAAAQIVQQQPAAPAADGYLSAISDESLEVLSHFGAETPAKLNAYSIQVEDALLESLGHQQQQSQVIAEQRDYIERVQAVLQAASADREAMMTILTDPATLSDYTLKFFSEDGPYPVQTPAEAAQAALEQGMVQSGEPLMPRAENPRMDPYGEALAQQQAQAQAFQRPQMPPMPNPAAASSGQIGDPWSQFSQLMDTNPQDAWKVLATAPADAVRRKVLFMEG